MILYFIFILVYKGRKQTCRNLSIGNAMSSSFIDRNNHHTYEFEGKYQLPPHWAGTLAGVGGRVGWPNMLWLAIPGHGMHEGRTGMHDVLPYQIDWPALIAEPPCQP
jgi:hypothetical protein